MKQKERDKVAELFEKRTGVKYQNWIQALSVSSKPKRLALVLLPKWIALVVLVSGLLYFLSCTMVGYIPLQDNKGVQHLYKEEADLLHLQKVTRYCATHHTWEKIQAVWDDSTYIYYTTRGS